MRKFNIRMPKFVTKSVNCSTKFALQNSDEVRCTTAQNVAVGNGVAATNKAFVATETTLAKVYAVCAFGGKTLYLAADGLYEQGEDGLVKKVRVQADEQSMICLDSQTNRLFVTTEDGTVRYNGDSDERTLMVSERMTSLVCYNGRVFGTSGKRLYFTDTAQSSFNEDDDGGYIEFASTVGCVCNFKNKLYVFADGVYTLAPDLDEAYFIVTKVCESSPDVSFATAVCDKLYCATSDGMMVYDGGKFSKLSLSVGSLGTIQMLSAQNGQLVIADNKQTIFYNPTMATAEVYGFAAKSAAITATEAVLCDGNGIATLQTNADGGSWYGTLDFGYAATKCLRKAVIVGKGKSVITVESNGRYVTVDFDGDGSAATVPCYIVGRQLDVTAKLSAGASVQSVGFVGVVFDEEVKL